LEYLTDNCLASLVPGFRSSLDPFCDQEILIVKIGGIKATYCRGGVTCTQEVYVITFASGLFYDATGSQGKEATKYNFSGLEMAGYFLLELFHLPDIFDSALEVSVCCLFQL